MLWQLERDVVVLGAVRLVVQRIASAHWRAAERLRSWGVAPLHRAGDALFAACAAGESLWIGAWLEDESRPAQIRVTDAISGKSAAGELPRDYQITTLRAEGDAPEPLTLPGDLDQRLLVLEIGWNESCASIAFTLLAPRAWAALAGREPPPALDEPPPLPPLLG